MRKHHTNDRGTRLPSRTPYRNVYTNLHDQEIRTLLLAPGSKTAKVVCTLEVAESTKVYQYEALSYVWGETAQTKKTIKCNGFDVDVTESLFTALMHLRYPSMWRRLWVDQLCIDQTHELVSQVRHMGSIYSDASRVLVWFGIPDLKLEQAWRLVQETSSNSNLVRSDFVDASPARQPQRPQFSPRSSYGSRRSSRSSITNSTSCDSFSSIHRTPIRRSARPHEPASPLFKNALAIVQHPWFSRKWTFQEIVLAKAAVLCCGEFEMAWTDLSAWYFHYAVKAKLRSSSVLYDSLGAFENIINVRNELERHTEWEGPPVKLSYLLMLTRQRRSLMPEDAVYAVLGLHPGFAEHLAIRKDDTTRPMLFDLFLEVHKYCLEAEDDLSILSAAGIYRGNQFSAFPSWLADWRQQLPLRPMIMTAIQHGDEKSYNATGPTKPVYDISCANEGLLKMDVRGFRIGRVVTRAERWPHNYFVAGDRARTILETRGYSAYATPLADFKGVSGGASTTTENELCESISTVAVVETGDWVCALFGGAVLYVFRPVSNSSMVACKYVGECAVVGLMDGKLMDDLEEHEIEDFHLV